jgi:hypothetical protein
VAVLALGLGVREWRAGFPAQALRLERFDRGDAEAPVAVVEEARPAGHAGPPTRDRAASHDGPASRDRPPPATPSGTTRETRPLDLNRATADDLARLPGIDPGLARRIVAERVRRGRFDSVDGLRGVIGLGPKRLAALRGLVTVGE